MALCVRFCGSKTISKAFFFFIAYCDCLSRGGNLLFLCLKVELLLAMPQDKHAFYVFVLLGATLGLQYGFHATPHNC